MLKSTVANFKADKLSDGSMPHTEPITNHKCHSLNYIAS